MNKFLICDDHPVCCVGLRVEIEGLFPGTDMHFVFAFTAYEALELLRQHSFQFVFMDIKLPDATGISVIRQSQKYLEQTKVILVTGDNTLSTAERIQKALEEMPIQGVIQKTHNTETLTKLFQHLHRNEDKPFVCADTEALLRGIIAVDLTRREVEIMSHVIKGLTTPEIAGLLGCSQETVKSHRSNMLLKTKTRNFAELSAWYSTKYSQGR